MQEGSSSDEEDQQLMTPYQELLANLGADGAGDDDLSGNYKITVLAFSVVCGKSAKIVSLFSKVVCLFIFEIAHFEITSLMRY